MSIELYHANKGIHVRQLHPDDAESLLQLRLQSREANQQYEPRYPEEFFTLASQLDLIYRRRQEAAEDWGYLFGIFITQSQQLIGTISLSHIVRGVGQFAEIGYSLSHLHQGQGYMTAAVKLIVDYAFRSLGLHRIQAGIIPHNTASRRVVEKCGFQPEGIARQLVKINGQWEDHQIYAILASDLEDPSFSSTAGISGSQQEKPHRSL
ncbi:GNAT family N-acetyltransferase [Paenibacillus wulumuqiensis]|uniref:GNAT family N-acetyltransferase n=1 Tax=Paenibacillus wulumuqiensis TaxID=1567107 RepID=UPI0006192F8E|nr:GNAT family protein [Paenibacillus wulumuqiensis]